MNLRYAWFNYRILWKQTPGGLLERAGATDEEWVEAYLLLGGCTEAGGRLPEAAEVYAKGLRYYS